MNFKKIGRLLVCLLLVVCLIVNISPIRAQATVTTAMAVSGGVVMGLAVAAVMQALGVRANTSATSFTNMVNKCVDALSPTWAVDGLVTMLSVTSGSVTKTYASQNFMQAVLDWLFDTGRLIYPDNYYPAGSSYTFSNGDTITSDGTPFTIFRFTYKNSSGTCYVEEWAISEPGGNLLYFLNGSTTRSQGSSFRDTLGTNQYFRVYQGPTYTTSDPNSGAYLGQEGVDFTATLSLWVIYCFASGNYPVDVLTKYDLTLESVGREIDADYETYVDTGIVSVDFGIQFEDNPNTDRDESKDNDVGWLPVRLLEMIDGYYADQTQADAQTGKSQVEFDYVDDSGAGTGTDYTSWFQRIVTGIEELPSKFQSWITDCKTAIEELPSKFESWIIDCKTAIEELPSKFAAWFDPILEWLSKIVESVSAIPQTIIDGILAGLQAIFVPSEDFLTVKVEAIRAEYAFADSIIATGEFIGNSLSGLDTTPPVIYIHLDDARGSHNIGGTVPFIDMTWYSEYKPTVDVLLSALLWIVFCWRIFLKLPGIISGMPGDYVMDGLDQIGFSDSLPSRKAGYEFQRKSNRDQIRRRKE